MTILVEKRAQQPPLTRSRQPQSATEYKIWNDARTPFSRELAYYHFINNIPAVQDALLLNSAVVTPTKSPFLYYGTATYRVDPMPSENAPLRWTGTTRGGKARIFRSLETVQTWSRPKPDILPIEYKDIRDLNGALGVDDDNNVQGADVVAPDEEWTLTAYIPETVFTPKYRATVRRFTPCVNLKKWYDFDPFEVLFTGADFDDNSEGSKITENGKTIRLIQITYYFKAGFNETNLTIGDLGAKDDQGIDIPIFKRAHDRLEIEWEEELDEETLLLTRRPAAARLERLYEARKFSALGLGGQVNENL